MKRDSEFCSVEDFIVEGDDGEQGLGFLSSVEETSSAATKGIAVEPESDR